MVRYAILGPVELCDGERRAAVGGPRQVTLLALLLLNANRALSTDRLIDGLWGDLRPAAAVNRLHVTIARLRRTLDRDAVQGESMLRRVGGGYLLVVGPGELDAEVFQTRVQEGRRALRTGQAERARDALCEALAMWRGPALADVAYEAFAQPEIRRLEELRLAALEARVECGLGLGEHGAVIGELEALVAEHLGHERLVAQLMLALYRCGRQGDALEVYTRTRAYLSSELGLQPGPALQTLQADILGQSPALQLIVDQPAFTAGTDRPGHDVVAVAPIMLALPRALHAPAGFPFVGREAQLARLRGHWNEIEEHGRSAVVVGGDAGIGKTRLASELAREVHRAGALVLYGRCDEGLEVPYQPFVEALRPYVRAVGPDRLRAELGHLAAELGRLLPELVGLGEPLHADPQSERFALFEAVAALIEAMTRRQRVLLVVDDLHWAATPTLLLLRHLIRSERRLDALVLATYRETQLSQPLAQLLADVQRDSSAQRLSIGGLDEQAIAALLKALTGQAFDERDAALVALVRRQTGGNAFFIREFLAHLCESGVVNRTSQRRTYDLRAAELWVPEGVGEVICQRVARFSQPARRALSVGAVAGSSFSLALLEHVLGDSEDVLGALDEAVAAGLLTEAGPATYGFAHALVRQVLYAGLSAARRMRLHRQLGEALEAMSDPDAEAGALAHHFAQAAADGQAGKAAAYALAAGRSATARLGYEEAAAHYEQGLQALALGRQPNERRRCELLLALGDARWGAGELDNARRAYGQGADLAERLGDATALARAALGFCGFHRPEWHATVIGPVALLLQRALAMLGDDDSALRAQLMGRLAAARAYSAVERVNNPRLARKALEMARRVADNATLADVLASTLWATRGPDNLQESLAMARELGRVADEIADGERRAMAHVWLLDFLLELGDIDAVKHELDALQRLVETRRERHLRWVVAALRANDALLGGRLEDCETLAHDARAYRYEGNDEIAARVFGVQMLALRITQGRFAEIVQALEFSVAQDPQIAAYRCALAYVYTQLGRTTHARQELAALARENFEDLPRDATWLPSLVTLSAVVVCLDDAFRAQQLYKLLSSYPDRNVVTGLLLGHGSASRSLGLLATTLTRYEDAERHFEQALTMNIQIRAPVFIAQTQHDDACMLLLRNRPGDREKALELLKDALATAEELGLKALADHARPLKQTAEAIVPPAAVPRPA